MSWTQENALKRIFNVFKRSKDRVYKEDIEALKVLNDELNGSRQILIQDNLLFAKLLCYCLNQNLHDKGNIQSSIKCVGDILKEPLDYHVQMFQMNLNNQDINNYLESIGINTDMFDFSKNDNEKILNDNEKEIALKLKQFWNYEKVEKSFYNTANQFLKETENYI